jgi:hypothetical protein
VKSSVHHAHHADKTYGTFPCIAVPTVRLHINFVLEVTTMFTTRQLIQSAFVAATVAATAPVHADASFATGGHARFAAQSVQGSPVPATPELSFATGGYARFVRDALDAHVADPTPTVGTRHPSFATGGYARHAVSDASGIAGGDNLRIAGYPWDNDGYKSDGGFAPADAVIVAGYPWDNDGYKSDGWRSPELKG